MSKNSNYLNYIPAPKDEKTLDALNKYQEIAKINSKITQRVETIDKFKSSNIYFFNKIL